MEAMIERLNREFLVWLVHLWTGFGREPRPLRTESVVAERVGDFATVAIPVLLALQSEFYSSTAYETAPSLAAAGMQAKSEFMSRFPEIDVAVAEALEWCYTYDCK